MSRSDTILTLLGELDEIRATLGPDRDKIATIPPLLARIDALLTRYRPDYPKKISGTNRGGVEKTPENIRRQPCEEAPTKPLE